MDSRPIAYPWTPGIIAAHTFCTVLSWILGQFKIPGKEATDLDDLELLDSLVGPEYHRTATEGQNDGLYRINERNGKSRYSKHGMFALPLCVMACINPPSLFLLFAIAPSIKALFPT